MKYNITIHPYDLELVVFTTSRSLVRYCNKNGYKIFDKDDNLGIDFSVIDGLTIYYSDNTILLLLPKEYDEKVVDHELIHVTWFVSNIIGQPMSWDNNEFQAYLFTDLKNKVKKKVWKRN